MTYPLVGGAAAEVQYNKLPLGRHRMLLAFTVINKVLIYYVKHAEDNVTELIF